jgi:hypothetical protein
MRAEKDVTLARISAISAERTRIHEPFPATLTRFRRPFLPQIVSGKDTVSFFPPPVLSGSGSQGSTTNVVVLSAGFLQLPRTFNAEKEE